MVKQIVSAPLPGVILRVHVKNGDTVKKGEVICEIESMKMENPILAEVSGIVDEVRVSQGQIVKVGDVIAVIGAKRG